MKMVSQILCTLTSCLDEDESENVSNAVKNLVAQSISEEDHEDNSISNKEMEPSNDNEK